MQTQHRTCRHFDDQFPQKINRIDPHHVLLAGHILAHTMIALNFDRIVQPKECLHQCVSTVNTNVQHSRIKHNIFDLTFD